MLVPVFYGDHIHHRASLDLFIKFDKSSGGQALLFIGSIRERLSVIGLSGDEYADALTASATTGIVGGGIYDAMLAHCALKAKAETIYTWNVRHYALCGPAVFKRPRTP